MANDSQEPYDFVRETGAVLICLYGGLLERYHITRTKLGFDSCVVVTARYDASGVLLNRQTLYPALHQIVLANAALSVQVDVTRKPDSKPKSKPAAPCFVRLPVVLLDDVVSFIEGSDIEKLIADELARPLELGSSTPLWRLTIVSGRTLVFAFHHGIGDGQSGQAFHFALLSALNSPSDTLHVYGDKISIPTVVHLVPPIEALTSVSVSFAKFCSTIFGTFAPKSLTKGASAWTGNTIVSTPTVQAQVRCWEIEAAQAAELVTLCRKNSTTLTACLHTLVAGVLARLVSTSMNKGRKPFKTLSTSVPVSLRRFTGASPYVMCDHISSVQTYVPIASLANTSTSDPWFSWTAAAQFGKRVQRSAKGTREVIGTLHYLYVLGISEAFFLGALGSKRSMALEVSNLGRFPEQPAGENGSSVQGVWSLSRIYFAQCDAVVGAAMKMNVAGSPTGTVNVAFTWGQGALNDEFAEAVIRDTKAALVWVIQSSLIS
ncbi:uncharacterized protein PHACADRAFT_145210 [Phanerochaete carnosa HHB-10118-sp]|uniref:Alcohol acetyltransferase n=1 Tax=Phanerochaete carnosa (strain HHB-10118-sp) TaxID=650164 RepID=K5V0V0_PHACS|nr:uncharacterized protein PHACADRAFT_145210 [Phanerochaete carnosa HHB-10118-sp]EKM56106.1 hypothetical protein PHACADRAFT_145210 [Phanerochaete carnosa HHB-10118-sp]